MKRTYRKNILLKALKKAGLPFTTQNFVSKYENTFCQKEDCLYKGKPFLTSPRNGKSNRRDRLYTANDIKEIIKNAKKGWFEKHWHWFPEERA